MGGGTPAGYRACVDSRPDRRQPGASAVPAAGARTATGNQETVEGAEEPDNPAPLLKLRPAARIRNTRPNFSSYAALPAANS